MSNEPELCHCGKPLHYSNKALEDVMRSIIKKTGPTVPMTVNGRTWLVPKHYIALHGVKGELMHTYGFKELT